MPSLPNEILLEIFAHLDYISLKKCMRVSKTFKSLTEFASLDANLLRLGKHSFPGNHGGSESPGTLHPALEGLTYNFFRRGMDKINICGANGKEYSVMASRVLDELAISPPVSILLLKTPIEQWMFPWRNAQGFTVNDVIEVLTKQPAGSYGLRRRGLLCRCGTCAYSVEDFWRSGLVKAGICYDGAPLHRAGKACRCGKDISSVRPDDDLESEDSEASESEEEVEEGDSEDEDTEEEDAKEEHSEGEHSEEEGAEGGH